MKPKRSTGTLLTVFSAMAALLCLLVGLQLLTLATQIGQADTFDQPPAGPQLRQWQALARSGAVMALGAGVLMFLFGVRFHALTVAASPDPSPGGNSPADTIDPDSLSIRVFESDAADRFVEISSPRQDDDRSFTPVDQAPPGRPTAPAPGPAESAVEPEVDPTDSIVQSIREAMAAESGKKNPRRPLPARRSILRRLFRFYRGD